MRNICPEDADASADGISVKAAMQIELICPSFRASVHGDFTLIAQLFGKQIYLPIPDGEPRYSQQRRGITYDTVLPGFLKRIMPADGNRYAFLNGIWLIEAYASDFRGIKYYTAPIAVLREWLCNTVIKPEILP